MAKDKNKNETDGALALAPPSDLAEMIDDSGATGIEEFGDDDIKIASKVWNSKSVDERGRARTPDVFVDSLTGESAESLECVLLSTKKGYRWDEFDQAADKTVVMCESHDLATGTMSDGTRRSCHGCPDKEWAAEADGRRTKRCGTVHTVVGYEPSTARPFIIRFKKTSLDPFRRYVQTYFKGQRKTKEGRADLPLFSARTTITLAMHESGKYALPVFSRGDFVTREEFAAYREQADAMRSNAVRYVEAESAASVDAIDVAPATGEFAE